MNRRELIDLYVQKYITGDYSGCILEEIDYLGIYEEVLDEVEKVLKVC